MPWEIHKVVHIRNYSEIPSVHLRVNDWRKDQIHQKEKGDDHERDEEDCRESRIIVGWHHHIRIVGRSDTNPKRPTTFYEIWKVSSTLCGVIKQNHSEPAIEDYHDDKQHQNVHNIWDLMSETEWVIEVLAP